MGNIDTETTGGGTARQRENRMMTGLFKDRESAEGAYRSLNSRGYGKDDVNLMMSDDTRKKYFTDDESELGTKHGKVSKGELGAAAWVHPGSNASSGKTLHAGPDCMTVRSQQHCGAALGR